MRKQRCSADLLNSSKQAMPDSLYEKQRASAVDGASLLLLDREVKNELTWIKKKGDARYPMNKNDRIYFHSDAKQYQSCDSESPVWFLLCSRAVPCSARAAWVVRVLNRAAPDLPKMGLQDQKKSIAGGKKTHNQTNHTPQNQNTAWCLCYNFFKSTVLLLKMVVKEGNFVFQTFCILLEKCSWICLAC